jgi:glycosyltransferase involved in cell wall biosynthesis
MLQKQLRVPRPLVVMNCSERAQVQDERADLIRTRLDLPASARIVLYQGIVLTERGIEESMDAILEVPDAVLVVMGNGPHRPAIAARAAESRYAGRVELIDAVPPAELIRWTSSADVMVIAIPATSDNHRYAIPNKLFEAMAAGVPVVASDLPGMAPIIREVGAGVLCDPRSPASIAAGLRTLLEEAPDVAAERRSRILEAARTRYAWESHEERLLELWQRLLQ